MRIINLRHCQTEQQANEYLGKFLSEANYDQVIEGETTKVFKPDGSVLCVLIKNAIPKEYCLEYYKVLHNRITATNNRGTASGQKMIHSKKKDGTMSKRNRTPVPVNSSVIGFFDRNPAFPYCRVAAFNEKNPALFAKCLPFIQSVDQQFREYLPERHKIQSGVAMQTNKDFVIPGTTFTTVTLNKNFRTAAHKDAGDLPDGFGCITLLRTGKYSGGLLVFPRYYVAIDFDTTDLVLFDPHEVHGNTAINPITKEWERITSVFYYRKDMVYCGSHEEELKRAQSGLRTKR